MANILVVDDEKSIRIPLREFLKEEGYKVSIAKDADEAMGLLKQEQFDVAMTDIILPRITGVDLLQTIKKTSPDVQVVMMTGEPTVETASAAMRAGAFDYLIKPIGKELLLKTIANATKVKALEDERRILAVENLRYQENLKELVEERTIALRASEALLAATGRMAKVGGWELDAETNEVSATDEFYHIYDFPKDSELSISEALCLHHPEDRLELETAIEKARQYGESWDLESRITTTKGKHIWVRSIGHAAVVDGKTVKLFGMIQDITEHKRVEEALKESKRYTRGLIEANLDAWVTISTEGKITDVNIAAEVMIGMSRKELIGTAYSKYCVTPNAARKGLEQCFRDGYVRDYPLEMRHRDGTVIPVLYNASVYKDTKGNVMGVIAAARDITRRKVAEEALRKSEKKFSDLFEKSGDAMLIIKNGMIVDCNQATVDLLKYSDKEDILNAHPSEISPKFQPDGRKSLEKANGVMAIALKEGMYCFEWDHEKSNDEIISVEVMLTAISNSPGEEIIHAVWRDITDRKKAVELTTRFNRVLEGSLNEIYIFDAETLHFVEVNRGARKNLGYSIEELRGLTPVDLKPEFTLESFSELIEPLRAGTKEKIQFTTTHYRKDGSEYPVEVHLQLMPDGPSLFIAIILDISERKQAEKERERSEVDRKRLISAIEQAAESFIITDAKGTIQYVNSAFEQIAGYTRDEAIGQKPNILKSGKQNDAFYKEMWEILLMGDSWRNRLVNKKKDGTFYTAEMVISPVRDLLGETINYVAVQRDITEEIKLEAQLSQAQKMESVGRLAGGVAHDFNNMLGVILGHTEMALNNIDPSQSLHGNLIEILKATERSASLTRQLLTFARKQAFSPKVQDLNETVGSLLKMLQRLIGEDINLVWKPQKSGCWVNMDPSQIDQILANLCVNARDAIKDVGTITIETEIVILDDAFCMNYPELKPGEYVLLTVSDDGSGMDEKTQAKIFEPFFTTKELGKGTGLGLATVYGIIKQNKGLIHVSSKKGQGTTFKIYMPRHAAKVTQIQEKGPAEQTKRGGETILLVEDEPAILEMVTKILKDCGYTVLAAPAPGEAIRLAREFEGCIHLLITDMVMPEMNGQVLAQNLSTNYPNLKCLFMSGYATNVIADHGILDENMCFIQKPFKLKDLVVKAQQVMDK